MVPIPNRRGRHDAAPFGLGSWDGARVASQQSPTPRPGQRYCIRPAGAVEPDRTERRRKGPRCGRLFDPSCPWAARDPSRLGQLEMCPGCGGLGPCGPKSAARCFGWSGPDGEEFAPAKSASAETDDPAELLTVSVSGTLRRNGLGAIASAKNARNFPQRSDDNRNESRTVTAATTRDAPRPMDQ